MFVRRNDKAPSGIAALICGPLSRHSITPNDTSCIAVWDPNYSLRAGGRRAGASLAAGSRAEPCLAPDLSRGAWPSVCPRGDWSGFSKDNRYAPPNGVVIVSQGNRVSKTLTVKYIKPGTDKNREELHGRDISRTK